MPGTAVAAVSTVRPWRPPCYNRGPQKGLRRLQRPVEHCQAGETPKTQGGHSHRRPWSSVSLCQPWAQSPWGAAGQKALSPALGPRSWVSDPGVLQWPGTTWTWHPKAVMESGGISPVCLSLTSLIEPGVPGWGRCPRLGWMSCVRMDVPGCNGCPALGWMLSAGMDILGYIGCPQLGWTSWVTSGVLSWDGCPGLEWMSPAGKDIPGWLPGATPDVAPPHLASPL